MGWNWNHQIDIDANAIVACAWTQYHDASAGSNPCSPEQALHWACEVCKTICAIVLSSSIVIPKQPHFQRSKFKIEVDIDLLEYIWTYLEVGLSFFILGQSKFRNSLFRPFGSFMMVPSDLNDCLFVKSSMEKHTGTGNPQKYLLLKFYIDYIRYLPLWYPYVSVTCYSLLFGCTIPLTLPWVADFLLGMSGVSNGSSCSLGRGTIRIGGY
jgi:hypothetical protein